MLATKLAPRWSTATQPYPRTPRAPPRRAAHDAARGALRGPPDGPAAHARPRQIDAFLRASARLGGRAARPPGPSPRRRSPTATASPYLDGELDAGGARRASAGAARAPRGRRAASWPPRAGGDRRRRSSRRWYRREAARRCSAARSRAAGRARWARTSRPSRCATPARAGGAARAAGRSRTPGGCCWRPSACSTTWWPTRCATCCGPTTPRRSGRSSARSIPAHDEARRWLREHGPALHRGPAWRAPLTGR